MVDCLSIDLFLKWSLLIVAKAKSGLTVLSIYLRSLNSWGFVQVTKWKFKISRSFFVATYDTPKRVLHTSTIKKCFYVRIGSSRTNHSKSYLCLRAL